MSALTDVIDKLAALENADAVATKLREEGITGRLANAGQCPLARYVMKCLPMQTRVFVGPLTIRAGRFEEVQKLPSVLRDFVHEVDRGNYPELIESDDT